MRASITKFIVAAIFGSFMITGCSKNNGGSTPVIPPPSCSGTAYSYATDVKPIFISSCTISGCHDASSVNSGGPFTTWALIHAKASTVEGQVSAGIMPQTGSLTSDQKKKIICWVEAGALNN